MSSLCIKIYKIIIIFILSEEHGDLPLLRPKFHEEQTADEPRLSYATASQKLILLRLLDISRKTDPSPPWYLQKNWSFASLISPKKLILRLLDISRKTDPSHPWYLQKNWSFASLISPEKLILLRLLDLSRKTWKCWRIFVSGGFAIDNKI